MQVNVISSQYFAVKVLYVFNVGHFAPQQPKVNKQGGCLLGTPEYSWKFNHVNKLWNYLQRFKDQLFCLLYDH